MLGMAMSRRVLCLSGAAALAAGKSRAQAQGTWPSQPIRLIVPFAPGGTTDLTARMISGALAERLLERPAPRRAAYS